MIDQFPVIKRKRAEEGRSIAGHEIKCAACGIEDFMTAEAIRLPANKVAERFVRKGWFVGDAGNHACPACMSMQPKGAKSRRTALAETLAVPKSMTKDTSDMKTPTPEPAPAAIRSPAAATGLGLLYMAFADNFDVTKGRYRGDWSDEKVAKETGLSLEFVRQRRESDLGPLNVAPDMDRLRAQLVDLERQHGGQIKIVEDINKRGDKIVEEMRELAKMVELAIKNANVIAGRIDAIKNAFAPVTP